MFTKLLCLLIASCSLAASAEISNITKDRDLIVAARTAGDTSPVSPSSAEAGIFTVNIYGALSVTFPQTSIQLANGAYRIAFTSPTVAISGTATRKTVNIGGRPNVSSATPRGEYIGVLPVRFTARMGGTVTQQLPVRVRVINAIGIQKNSDLAFGEKFTGSPSAEATTPATFTVTGEPNTAFFITVPQPNVVIMRRNGSGSTSTTKVNITRFRHTAGISPRLAGDGRFNFNVYGTHADIHNNQASGSYFATFPVRVDYP